MPSRDNVLNKSAWAGYAFAAIATGVMIVLRREIGSLPGEPLSLPLCGLAAVIASIWWAGTGPGLAAAALTTAWYVWDFRGPGAVGTVRDLRGGGRCGLCLGPTAARRER